MERGSNLAARMVFRSGTEGSSAEIEIYRDEESARRWTEAEFKALQTFAIELAEMYGPPVDIADIVIDEAKRTSSPSEGYCQRLPCDVLVKFVNEQWNDADGADTRCGFEIIFQLSRSAPLHSSKVVEANVRFGVSGDRLLALQARDFLMHTFGGPAKLKESSR